MKSKYLAILASASCILTLVALMMPRASAQSVQAQAPASVRVNTRLIQVDVLVQDSQGKPITGLTQKDFKITDEGQEMPVSFFSVLSGDATASPHELAPNIFTNAPSQHPNIPTNLTVILVDALNTPYGDQIYSTQQLIRYLSQLKPTDHVAIYTLGQHLRVLHDFTTDDAALVAAIQEYKSDKGGSANAATILQEISATKVKEVPGDAMAGTISGLQTNLSNIEEEIPVSYRNDSLGVTLAALRAIALHLAGIPGRKNLLWLSGGFPLQINLNNLVTFAGMSDGSNGAGFAFTQAPQPAVYFPQLQQTLRLLETADVAVYPIDARGLMAQTAAADAKFANTQTGGPGNEDTSGENLMTMNAIADRTGGRAFFNTNAIAGALSTAQDDAQYSYLIGYYPQTEWDGKFHKIRIDVSQPGAHIRAREGYFALAAPKSPDEDRLLSLATVANASLDATEIPFTVQISPLATSAGTTTGAYAVLISVRGSYIHFTEQDDHWNGELEFIAVQRDASGRPIANSANKMRWAIPAAQYQEALNALLTNTMNVTIMSSAEDLRFIVRDPNSREIGSVSIPVGKLPSVAPR